MTPAELLLIKHAQNEIIALCNGLNAVASITSYGRSSVGRWADVGDPQIMPLPVVIRLEQHCKVPVVTAAMAAISNRKLTDPVDDGAAQQCVLTAHAEAFVASGELTASFAQAISDGTLTPNELTDLDRVAAHLERAIGTCRKALAAQRAAGGLKVVG